MSNAIAKRLIMMPMVIYVILSIFSVTKAMDLDNKPLQVDVFTITTLSHADPLFLKNSLPKNSIIHIYALDQLIQINQAFKRLSLNVGKIHGEDSLHDVVMQWAHDNQSAIRQSVMGINFALRFNVQQLPSVVFDGRAQVVGTLDVNRAYTTYLRYLSDKKRENHYANAA